MRQSQHSEKFHTVLSVLWLFAPALLLRLILSCFSQGHPTDMSCFAFWADRIYRLGPGEFYSPEVFTDYPPGYMYLLYPIGALSALLELPYLGGFHRVLLKLPAVLCDLVIGGLLYRESGRTHTPAASLFFAAAWLYNPAVLLNSAVWGQVDSVLVLCCLFFVLSLQKGRLFPACAAYGAGVLLKPQMLIFTPVLLAGIIESVFDGHRLPGLKPLQGGIKLNRKQISVLLLQGLAVAGCMLLLAAPFGLSRVLSQYTDTLSSYPYLSVNAYNFYSMLGLNWASQEILFVGVPLRIWNYLLLGLIVLAVIFFSYRLETAPAKYPLLCGFVTVAMFTFSVRMHERYLYPVLLFLLLAWIAQERLDRKNAFGAGFIAFSLLHFANAAHVLYLYDPSVSNQNSLAVRLISLGLVLCAGYYCRCLLPGKMKTGRLTAQGGPCRTDAGSGQQNSVRARHTAPDSGQSLTTGKLSLGKHDILLLTLITVLYSCFALYDLGDRQAPETVLSLEAGDTLNLCFEAEHLPSFLAYYMGPREEPVFAVNAAVPTDGALGTDASDGTDSSLPEENRELGQIRLGNVFTWGQSALSPDWFTAETSPASNQEGSVCLSLTLTQGFSQIAEWVFLDEEGQILLPANADSYPALFDEQNLYPTRSSFRNSMYFDEIYHARTAYEFLHGMPAYENTHPPMGKIFISVGIALFGMNPFGFRIIGVLFGIAMLPILYLFAKRLTKNTGAAALACLLFAFDFMHFVQTRIATIDVYITFFVLLMYFFMYCFLQEAEGGSLAGTARKMQRAGDKSLQRPLLYLGACGVSMGLGIACKWSGVYAGAGLGILFFACMYRQYRRQCPPANLLRIIRFCLLFFAVIPFLIYLFSYLPFHSGGQDGSLFARMLQNQSSMLRYHQNLNATHPYSSPWYQWPVITLPVWYYNGAVGDTLREGISAFGNPLVWWPAIPAFFYMLYLALRKKDRNAAFLVTAYLAQYVPWFFVTRITFIYHYFPSVPFLVLMLAYAILQWKKRLSERGFLLLLTVYGLSAFLLFLLFYPVLAGQPVELAYAERYLRWLEGWVLVY